jgi:type I restriction enzyme S subunit
MEVKPRYKQTEMGIIPEDWECGNLEKYFSFISYGFTNPMPTVEHGIYMVTAADIDEGRIQLETARRTTETAYRTLLTPKSKPKKNDILLTKDGSLGRLGLVGDEVMCINQSVAIIRPNQKVEPLFLKLLLESPRYQKRMLEDAGGSTIKHIYISIVNLMEIAIPSNREEQLTIAEALCDIDGLLGALDRLINKKRYFKQAAMQQLLTGQTRLPGFHDEWEVKQLKTIVQTPVTDGPHLTPRFLDDGIPFLSVNNLVENRIDVRELRFISRADHELFSRKCKPRTDDILLGKAASVGKVALVDLDLEFNIWSPIAMIRVNSDHAPRFVYYQLQSPDLIGQITLLTNSSSQGNIGMGDIGKLTLRLPLLSEQTAIAEVLSDMDAELAALEQRRDKTRDLKQAMMQELLTGRTRLV